MPYKFVSDIEDTSVEWESSYGKYWQTFETVELMQKALKENEAFNNLPENKAEIEAMEEANNVWLAKCDLEYYGGLEFFVENNMKMEFQRVIDSAKKYGSVAVEHISKIVINHNKNVLKTQFLPAPAVNKIGDFVTFSK
jgi:hypothetical protein